MISIPASQLATGELHIEDRATITPRTIDNDFGEIATRTSVLNTPHILENALFYHNKNGTGDATDKRRMHQLMLYGKFSDAKLVELTEFWKPL